MAIKQSQNQVNQWHSSKAAKLDHATHNNLFRVTAHCAMGSTAKYLYFADRGVKCPSEIKDKENFAVKNQLQIDCSTN